MTNLIKIFISICISCKVILYHLMVIFESVSLIAGAAKDLFLYNRQVFRFNREREQKGLFHLQRMQIDQVKLYREDLRDLFGLTVTKLDTYLLVSAITLLIAIAVVYEGRPPPGTPAWLFLIWSGAACSSILYLLLSQWFCIHGSVIAQTYLTRMLTQSLRLPVPSIAEIDAGSSSLKDFEHKEIDSSMRIPFTQRSSAEVLNSQRTDFTKFTDHFLLYQSLQVSWRGYDAYARVSLFIGAHHLVLALAISSIVYFGNLYTGRYSPIAIIPILCAFGAAHSYMNLLIGRFRLCVYCLLFTLCPLLAAVANVLHTKAVTKSEWIPIRDDTMKHSISTQPGFPITWEPYNILGLLSLACMIGAFLFIVILATTDLEASLPTKFATVQKIDVLGLNRLGTRRRKKHEVPINEAIPSAPVIRRQLVADMKGQTSNYYDDGLTRSCSTDSGLINSLESCASPDMLPYEIFTLMSAAILIILVCFLIYSVLVISNILTATGYPHNPVLPIFVEGH